MKIHAKKGMTALVVNSVYPHPARGAASLPIHLDATTHVRTELFALLGRRIRVLCDGLIQPGDHLIHVDVSSLPPGVYVVRVTAAGVIATRRVTILR